MKSEIYDICIIGTGPAGMTLAAELAHTGKKICILESGGLKKTPYADSLREVISSGDITIKTSSRERIVGGTSTTWAGLSSPLDEIDLINWPIKLSDLRPYYSKAANYGFAPFEEFNKVQTDGDLVIPVGRLELKKFIAADPAWNFGKKLFYIFSKENIVLKTDATVVGFNQTSSTITEAKIKDSQGNESTVSAKKFIIAAGGLESVRLLLSSNIGNEHDQVGRYIMNHPKENYGHVKLTKPVQNAPLLFGYLNKGFAYCAGVRLNHHTLKTLGILNSYIRLEPIFPWTDSVGVAALIALTKQAGGFLNWWKKQQKKIVNLRDWNETGDDKVEAKKPHRKIKVSTALATIVKDLPPVLSYSLHRLFPKKEVIVSEIRLRNFIEMEPVAENRITLTDKVDGNGQRIPKVHSYISSLDKKSLVELHRIFGEEIAKAGIGTLDSNLATAQPWPITADASHHLGGTIMGTNPLKSVVDKNLKVHSTNNLYIASGSVFPTSGCANPTYTICALSIRLAEHLKNTI